MQDKPTFIVKWLIVAILLFIVSLFFTPIGLFNFMGIWLAILEGVLCAFFMFLSLAGVENLHDVAFLHEEEYPALNRTSVIAIPIVLVILCTLAFSFNTQKRTRNLLKEEGITTAAKIVSGWQKTSGSVRRAKHTSYTLQLRFVLQNGRTFTASSEVSSEVYENVGLWQTVDIRYWPENPKVFEVLVGDTNLQEFLDISNRYLRFDDLEKLLDMPTDSVESYLNTISAKWVSGKDPSGILFMNQNKKEIILKGNDGSVLYKSVNLLQIDNFLYGVKIEEKTDWPKQNDEDMAIIKTVRYVTEKYDLDYTFALAKGDRSPDYYLVVRRR